MSETRPFFVTIHYKIVKVTLSYNKRRPRNVLYSELLPKGDGVLHIKFPFLMFVGFNIFSASLLSCASQQYCTQLASESRIRTPTATQKSSVIWDFLIYLTFPQ
jgi:hypothetical protein